MTDMTLSYRDEVASIACKLMNFFKERNDEHYDVSPRAYAPDPFIAVVTKDIDYFDGTILNNIVKIVEENHKESWYTYHVTGCKIIVTTKSGTMIDAYGMKLTFNFYEHKEEETE